MTDAKELERVRAIHRWLDARAVEYQREGYDCGQGGYTADEIRAWPEFKRQMRERLLTIKYSPEVFSYILLSDYSSQLNADPNRSYTAPAIARGFCMYREMVEDEKPAEPQRMTFAKRLAEQRANAEPPKPVDPYEQHRLSTPSEQAQREMMDTAVAHQAARARTIAALRVELDRPISEQPHPREYFSGAVRRYR